MELLAGGILQMQEHSLPGIFLLILGIFLPILRISQSFLGISLSFLDLLVCRHSLIPVMISRCSCSVYILIIRTPGSSSVYILCIRTPGSSSVFILCIRTSRSSRCSSFSCIIRDKIERIQQLRPLQSLFYEFLFVHINGGLKEEAFGDDVCLTALIILELVIMGTAEGQLAFDALLSLGKCCSIMVVDTADGLFASYLQYRIVYPGVTDGFVVLRERLGSDAPLIAAPESIESDTESLTFIFFFHHLFRSFSNTWGLI